MQGLLGRLGIQGREGLETVQGGGMHRQGRAGFPECCLLGWLTALSHHRQPLEQG